MPVKLPPGNLSVMRVGVISFLVFNPRFGYNGQQNQRQLRS